MVSWRGDNPRKKNGEKKWFTRGEKETGPDQTFRNFLYKKSMWQKCVCNIENTSFCLPDGILDNLWAWISANWRFLAPQIRQILGTWNFETSGQATRLDFRATCNKRNQKASKLGSAENTNRDWTWINSGNKSSRVEELFTRTHEDNLQMIKRRGGRYLHWLFFSLKKYVSFFSSSRGLFPFYFFSSPASSSSRLDISQF